MNNFEIETFLRDYPVTVCCANKLPATIKKRPQTFIVNTGTCDQSGTHWLTFHFPRDGPVEFFDSAGNAVEVYNHRFMNVLLANGPSCLYTKKQTTTGADEHVRSLCYLLHGAKISK